MVAVVVSGEVPVSSSGEEGGERRPGMWFHPPSIFYFHSLSFLFSLIFFFFLESVSTISGGVSVGNSGKTSSES